MLVFLVQDMVNYIYQFSYGYFDSIFFVHLSLQRFRERFAEFY